MSRHHQLDLMTEGGGMTYEDESRHDGYWNTAGAGP